MTLDQLIQKRLDELEMKKSELARGMGYAQNKLSRGCIRIDWIRAGGTGRAWDLRERLARGLQVPVEVVEAAIEDTRKVQYAAWRAAFKPYGVVLTENTGRPTCSLFIFAISGEGEKLTIRFEEGSDPATFVEQALRKFPKQVMGLGATTGFVVNYTPDTAILYDREGREIEELDEVMEARTSGAIIGGKWVGSETLSAMLGPLEVREG